MKTFIRASMALLLVSAAPVATAYAAATPSVVAETTRTVTGGRAVQVTVGQAEIKSDINPSNIAVYTGGGLIGALVQASVDAERAKKAEAAITPLRDALAGFDADGLAQSATKTAIAGVDWLNTDAVRFSKDATPNGKSSALDSESAAQIAFFDYTYDVGPDFSTVRVVVSMSFASKALPSGSAKPEARLKPRALAYAQKVTSVITLPDASKDINVNAQRWAADDAKLARQAVTLAFENAEKLIPRTLALTAADLKALKTKSNFVAGGYQGRPVEQEGGHTLLWDGSFIQVDALPQAQ
jgi:hypothetical protein